MRRHTVLSDAQLLQGIEACFHHAELLKAKALESLERRDNWLGLSLASIRMEELGKMKLLGSMLGAQSLKGEVWGRFWVRFTNHREKWLTAFEQTFEDLGSTYEQTREILSNELRKYLEEVAEDFSSGASLKNLGLYVDYDQTLKTFLEPSQASDYDTRATQVIELGDIFEHSLRDRYPKSP